MKYMLVVVTVLFFAVYGFRIYLPTANGTLMFSSGYTIGEER